MSKNLATLYIKIVDNNIYNIPAGLWAARSSRLPMPEFEKRDAFGPALFRCGGRRMSPLAIDRGTVMAGAYLPEPAHDDWRIGDRAIVDAMWRTVRACSNAIQLALTRPTGHETTLEIAEA